jgi:hypothetical protein
MTMHLLGPEYTTTNTRKRKQKVTKQQQAQRERAWHDHNRWLRQKGRPKITFEKYLDEISNKKMAKPEFQPLRVQTPFRRGSIDHIPSLGDGIGVAAKPERKEYSGERKLTGIATMHKSNMVPVFEEEGEDKNQYAKDLARMRR